MNSSVRRLKREDLPQVAALSGQLGYPCSLNELANRFEQMKDDPRHAFYVYEDATILGWIHLETVLDLIEEVKVEIKALVVDENERGKGIGKCLVAQAREWAKCVGVRKVYLSCNIMRERTHQFYIREGFQRVKTSLFFEVEI